MLLILGWFHLPPQQGVFWGYILIEIRREKRAPKYEHTQLLGHHTHTHTFTFLKPETNVHYCIFSLTSSSPMTLNTIYKWTTLFWSPVLIPLANSRFIHPVSPPWCQIGISNITWWNPLFDFPLTLLFPLSFLCQQMAIAILSIFKQKPWDCPHLLSFFHEPYPVGKSCQLYFQIIPRVWLFSSTFSPLSYTITVSYLECCNSLLLKSLLPLGPQQYILHIQEPRDHSKIDVKMSQLIIFLKKYPC